jgi:para-nitrobenzyl esterase
MSEDCLTLNVWTTNLDGGAPRPVIVWLHGGSYTMGSGGDEAASLTDGGVVVVTLNYRLGILGFLAHPALGAESPHRVSGNYGLLDQIEALRWVQRNIAAFGGDPARVTAIGHSAGAGAVLQLLASPLARDLVHRGIAQSGTLDMSRPLQAAEADGIATATTLGATAVDPLPVLRAATVEQILAVQPRGIESTTDGWVLPRPVPELLRTGRLDRVPLIIGATADEGDIFVIPSIDRDAFAQHVRTDVLTLSDRDTRAHGAPADALAVPDRVDRLLALYPSSGDATPAMRRYMTDRDFVCPARYAAAHRGGRTWLYRFSLPTARMGAFHGAELPLLFGTRGGLRSDAAARVGNAMRRYWIRFAIAGDPNEPGLPAWPAYSEAPARHLELGDPVRVTDRFDRPACGMHDEVWSGQ